MIQEVTAAGFKRVGRSSEWYRQSLSVQAGRNEAQRIANESVGHPVQQREQSCRGTWSVTAKKTARVTRGLEDPKAALRQHPQVAGSAILRLKETGR